MRLESRVQSPESAGPRSEVRSQIQARNLLATDYWLLTTTGLTVLELIVAMGVAGLFYGVLYNFYLLHARALKVQEVKLDLQESSRLAIDFLVRELHFAGARPVQGGTCAGF